MATTYLRRYTSLPVLLSYLRERKVTLVGTDAWPDKNDTHYLELYRKEQKLGCVLALCFSQAAETAHHWGMFASGATGICIQYDGPAFSVALEKSPQIVGAKVLYRQIKDLAAKRPKPPELPFLKRWPYRDEKEFRLIYGSKKEGLKTRDLPVPLKAIERITLSPHLPDGLVETVRSTIKAIDGCSGIKVYRSTLTNNLTWKGMGARNPG